MASTGDLPSFRSASRRKVDHHNRVFLDDADQQDQPDQRDHAEIRMAKQKCQQRPYAGGGKRRQNRDRMNIAFVKYAQHDVNRHQCRQDQQRFVGQRRLERSRRALESRLDAGGHVQLFLDRVNFVDGVAQRSIGGEVERNRYRRELALVIYRKRRRPASRNA